jgi:GNAT superfamily N-acetyltransferase
MHLHGWYFPHAPLMAELMSMQDPSVREDFPVPKVLFGQGIRLRRQRPDDDVLCTMLYTDIRWDELAQVPWTDEQKLAFLQSQSSMQQHHYRTHYAGSEFYVIEKDAVPIGRLYLDRLSPEEIRMVDLAFFRPHTGKGYGQAFIRAVQEAAAADGKSVCLHVEHVNPARCLYQRMGFREEAQLGVYIRMRWDGG